MMYGRVSFSNETTSYLSIPYWHLISWVLSVLCDCKKKFSKLKIPQINILAKFDTHLVHIENSNHGRQ